MLSDLLILTLGQHLSSTGKAYIVFDAKASDLRNIHTRYPSVQREHSMSIAHAAREVAVTETELGHI